MNADVAHPTVTLLDGSTVSSWSREWLEECRDRHWEVVAVLRLSDRESRREYIAAYERRVFVQLTAAGIVPNPTECAIEARRRLEAAVLDEWQRKRNTSTT